jgi:hypothetical protein
VPTNNKTESTTDVFVKVARATSNSKFECPSGEERFRLHDPKFPATNFMTSIMSNLGDMRHARVHPRGTSMERQREKMARVKVITLTNKYVLNKSLMNFNNCFHVTGLPG